MNPPKDLLTDRLDLKQITPALIHSLFNTQTKEFIYDYFQLDDAGYEKLKMMHEKGIETYNISLNYFLLVNKTNNEIIGECGFHTWNTTHRRADVFYSIRKDENKNLGYMSEALKTVLAHGFTDMNLHRVAAFIASDNIPSLKLLIKNGFKKEGFAREDYVVNGINEDSDCYSLLKWEWEKSLTIN
jgi:[ribosomal protein S5]-alanine N-acetyltransferase